MINSNSRKKKGRKPSAKILNKDNIKTFNSDNCLIAHIPVSLNQINKFNTKYKIQEKIIENKVEKPKNLNIDNKINLFSDSTYKKLDLNQNTEKTCIYEKKIKELEKKIFELENKKKCNLINYNYSSFNFLNKPIKKNNNLLCWWCCHSFENNPVYLPDYKLKDSIHVIGYFCSFNCAQAYNINLNDYKVWDRSAYLNEMYYKLNKKYKKISSAPSKFCLKKFGGDMDISEYRSKFLDTESNFSLIIPPLIPIIPAVEEYDKNKNKNNQIFIDNSDENLVLKRKTPIKFSNNSIEKAMNLKLYQN